MFMINYVQGGLLIRERARLLNEKGALDALGYQGKVRERRQRALENQLKVLENQLKLTQN